MRVGTQDSGLAWGRGAGARPGPPARLRIGVAVLLLGLCAAGVVPRLNNTIFLHSCGVALRPGVGLERVVGLRDCAGAGPYAADSRVLATEAGEPGYWQIVAENRAWAARNRLGDIPAQWRPLAGEILLDLHALTVWRGNAAWELAGPAPRWRYSWLRDTAVVAVAFARTGHEDDSLGLLRGMALDQLADGSFHPRYLPDSGQAPDSRQMQYDGAGWFLWAARQVIAPTGGEGAGGGAGADLGDLAQALTRAAHHLLDLTDNPQYLPPAGSDYWEHSWPTESLANAALTHAGLAGCKDLGTILGQELAGQCAQRAKQSAAAVVSRFGPSYARSPYGFRTDAGVDFLLPPFQDQEFPGAMRAFWKGLRKASRPSGGWAPGGGWRQDGVSWTPESTLHALVGAKDRPDFSVQILEWVARNRTASGAIPEKILPSGRPAGTAPLAWSGANTLLTLEVLGRQQEPR